jgi:subtilisin family serine protease
VVSALHRRPSILYRWLAAAATTATLLVASAGVAAAREPVDQPVREPVDQSAREPADGPAAEPASGLWLVRLTGPSLAAAAAPEGRVAARYRAPGDDRLDPGTSASRAHLAGLARQHEAALDTIEATLGRPVTVAHSYRNVVNGLAVAVDAAEAARLAELPGVAGVEPDRSLTLDTDVSHELIGSAPVWEGETGSGLGTRGEGVIVGMLDTGINPHHPSFAAVAGDGYRHTNPYGPGNYTGVCDPDHPRHEDICNDKLIGAWRMISGTGAQDDNGHGSHVGSTIAGNWHEARVTVGGTTHTRVIQGVAPRANIISYKVCTILCSSVASVAAVDQAISDGVDVLNYSISGPDDPWRNSVDQAFLEAFAAGIFVAASAGNDGPEAGTVAKTAPWNATVAATTHHRVIAHRLDVTTPAPPELSGLAAVPGEGSPTAPLTGQLRYADTVDPGNEKGCDPFPAGSFGGALALILRGDCNFSVKVDNAAEAGATGVVVYNQSAGPPLAMGGLEGVTIPAVMVGNADGVRLRDHLVASAGTPVEIAVSTGTEVLIDEDWADVVAEFSSPGPSRFDLLAPTFAAPGRNILAAYAEQDGDPVQYGILQGTSMASPHAAGAGALLTALHPDWSPAQIRSALAVTADREGILKPDGVTPADPFDIGSGRINLERAGRAGLTLDETREDFLAANPAAGGDPRTLNLPAVVDHHCDQVCSFTREVTSVAGVSAAYTAQVGAPDGVTVTVDPAQFTLAPGATQRLTITVEVTGLLREDWLFGTVDLVTDATHGLDGPPVAGAHLPVAVLPAQPALTVDPVRISSSALDVNETEVHTVTLGNEGAVALTWRVTEDGTGCALPGWVEVIPAEGTVAPFGTAQVEVRFDATGLDDGGVFTASLCLASNDPVQPVATIELELTVVPIPVVEVTPASLAGEPLPAGLVTRHTVTVRNVGHGVLDWTLADEDAGPSGERLALLRGGVLLVPNQTTGAVMAFDQQTGELLDEEFIPWHQFDPDRDSPFSYSPIHLLPNATGDGFLLSDQLRWVITEYDLAGNFRRVFAPTTGERGEIIGNIRGMSWSPWGTLLVTVASGDNADSIVELDADGDYLGTFIPPGLDELDSPWYVLPREGDILVSASGSEAIHSFALDGTTANDRFAGLNWPAQLVELDNGNILTVNWSGGDGPGVREFDRDGNLIGRYVASGSSYKGVHELGNGNLLVTTSTGVHEIDRVGEVFDTKASGIGTARYITHVRLPDAQPCVTPAEVPWLSVEPEAGATGAGAATELTVTLDTTGLAPGTHRAQLCLTSDDPATPLVRVPVSVEVTDQRCDQVVAGRRNGPLAVADGTTCLAPGAVQRGPVLVQPGAGLVAIEATVSGPVIAAGATAVVISDSQVDGPVSVRRSGGSVRLIGNQLSGAVTLTGNRTGEAPSLVSGNVVNGALWCTANQPPPVDGGVPNTVTGVKGGQCADL